MDKLLTIAKNIVYYFLLAKILTALVPEGTMRRYIKFFLGIILIIMVIAPILSFGNIENSIINSITQKKSQIDYKDLVNNSDTYNEINEDIAIDIYKDQLRSQISQLLSVEAITIHHIEVEINEDRESEAFGRLYTVGLTLEIEADSLVDTVVINTLEEADSVAGIDYEATLVKKRVKNILINFYNLPSDNINIIVENN